MAVNLQVYDFYWMINMTEKVPTRVNTQNPFTNFWTAKNLHPPFLYMQPAEPWSFLAATVVLQSMENLHVPCKRGCTGKKFGPVAFIMFILCGPCKEHTEKEVSRKNNEGKGYGVRAVGTPVMVLFNKSSFRILPVNQILVNPLNGLFWQLLSTVYYLMEMRSDSDEIIS